MEKVLAYAPRKRTELRAPLRRAHLSYRLATDEKQLERELSAFQPTVVLADVEMPQLSGADLLRRVGDRALVVLVNASSEHQVEGVLQRLRTGALESTPGRQGPPSVEDLHDPATGRLDARRIATWLGVSLTRFARFVGRPVQTLHKTPAAVGLQDALAVFARIATSLTTLFGTRDRARIWLNAPNPDLDGATPMSLLGKRKATVVADLLEDALLGHPG